MRTLIIFDTACLILFDKIDKLNILQKLFQQVTITPKIAEEFNQKTPVYVRK
jgi:predicted nucleic acid-binding protein